MSACSTTDDCVKHPALGSNFICLGKLCLPKVESGCTPYAGSSDFCLAGALGADGNCASPKGWVCDVDGRCLSGHCSNDNHCL
jgi:hypothetical protein